MLLNLQVLVSDITFFHIPCYYMYYVYVHVFNMYLIYYYMHFLINREKRQTEIERRGTNNYNTCTQKDMNLPTWIHVKMHKYSNVGAIDTILCPLDFCHCARYSIPQLYCT